MVKIFNRAYAGTELRRKNILRQFISDPVVKRNYGLRVIDEIRNRTKVGIDKKDIPFKAYSKKYRSSDIFKIFGKTRRVNMELSGEMLAAMIPIPKVRLNEVHIQFADPEQNAKAHGHTKGSKILPKRDFFGLPAVEEASIMTQVINDAAASNLITIAEDFLGDVVLAGQVGDQVFGGNDGNGN